MSKFKTFYNEKKGKYILFFGFYLIFFVFLGLYVNYINNNRIEKEEKVIEKEITTYNISNLINNDYSYKIEVLDNEDIITFNGTKNNIDYANFENKYFLDIYNINQLLKRSKLISSKNHVLTYNLDNKELNDILLTNKSEDSSINEIIVYVNDKAEINKIIFNLSNYFEKDEYKITIDYNVGDNNENSPS